MGSPEINASSVRTPTTPVHTGDKERNSDGGREEEVVSGITLHSFSVFLCTIGQGVYERVADILCQEVLHRDEAFPMQPPQKIQGETMDVLQRTHEEDISNILHRSVLLCVPL